MYWLKPLTDGSSAALRLLAVLGGEVRGELRRAELLAVGARLVERGLQRQRRVRRRGGWPAAGAATSSAGDQQPAIERS